MFIRHRAAMQLIIVIIGNSIFIFKTNVIATTIYLGETQHQHDLINPPITARFRFNQKLFYINCHIDGEKIVTSRFNKNRNIITFDSTFQFTQYKGKDNLNHPPPVALAAVRCNSK